MKTLLGLLLGILFSLGLSISGMVDPNKVINFLDITGSWDPSLMFVMGGAAGLNFILFRFILKRKNPLLDKEFYLPSSSEVDKKLLIGSAIFGIGWGIGGICPGPGFANLFLLNPKILVFVLSLIMGMVIFQIIQKKL